jgi:sugar phosphate isomerase/epimerase
VFDVEVVRIAADTDVETYVPMFAAAAELGAQRVCVNIDDPDRTRTIDRFAKLCDLAAPAGLSLDVEFMIWRPVARLEDAVAVVRGAGKRNGGVLVDALHLHRSGGSATDVAALDPALIGSFQLCDARGKAPDPSEIINEARTDRLPPGEGELPLRELIDALPPGMPLSLEIPMTRSAPELSPVARARRIYRAASAFLSKCA